MALSTVHPGQLRLDTTNPFLEDDGSGSLRVNLAGTPALQLDATGLSILVDGDTLETTTAGLQFKRQILSLYKTGTMALASAAYTTITWDVAEQQDSFYTWTAGGSDITITTDGWYRFMYGVTGNNDGTTRRSFQIALHVNGTEIPASRANTYIRNNSEIRGTAMATYMHQVTAGQVFSLRTVTNYNTSAITSVANMAKLQIEFLTE